MMYEAIIFDTSSERTVRVVSEDPRKAITDAYNGMSEVYAGDDVPRMTYEQLCVTLQPTSVTDRNDLGKTIAHETVSVKYEG